MNVTDYAIRVRSVGLGNEIPDVSVIGLASAMEIHRPDQPGLH